MRAAAQTEIDAIERDLAAGRRDGTVREALPRARRVTWITAEPPHSR